MAFLTSLTANQDSWFESVSPIDRTATEADVIRSDPVSISNEPKVSKNRPCDACRKRKSRCVVNEGAAKCVLCEFRSHDCTFLENILPRKRKSLRCEDEPDR